jgi:hypothetical protein
MSVFRGYDVEIMNDNNIHFQKFKNHIPNESYIAGFIDGDGCIFIRKINDGFQSGIQISQSRTNVLLILQYYFGGIIRQNHIKKTNESLTQRNQYVLNIRSNEYESILNYIYHHIIIKSTQIKALKQISTYVNKIGVNHHKEQYYNLCSTSNKEKTFDEEQLVKINIEYIAGLFDAEGCLYINKNKISKYRISISQKSYPKVLESIKQYLGFGYTNDNRYLIYSKEHCLKFINLIENNLIVKYNQSQYFKKYLETDDVDIKLEMYNKCNYEKHVNENFNYEMYPNLINKNLYNYYNNIIKIRKICLLKIETNNLLEKLKPINLETEIETETEIEIEIDTETEKIVKQKRNKITDDIILKVRELLNSGKKNIEIEKELNLGRHIISKIKNNILVLKNETKRNNIKKTQEQQNVERRKINIQIMLKVIDKLFEFKLPSVILSEILNETINEKCNLTIDIIKNIKRKIKDKIIPFYEFEISSTLFNH